MKKDKSVRKAELKKAAIKQLKSLIVPGIFLILIFVIILIIILVKPVEEQEDIVKVNAYEGEEEQIVLENNKLKLTMDSTTTQFELLVKETGKVWYSNPENADNDSIALMAEKDKLKSTLLLTYSTVNGVDTLYSNYSYSIVNKIYDIETTDDSITIFYSIGDVDKEYVIPTVITEERMKEYLANMSQTDANTVKDYYKKYDINNLGKKDDKDALLETYPILETEIVYILRDTTKDNLKSKFELYFADAGYTYEDYRQDKANDLSESTTDKPVFNISVTYALDGSDLVVSVPINKIEYKRDYPLINLSILPYFGAGSEEEDGFLFVPEGGGSLIYFNNGKISQSAYYANLYGWDYALGRDYVVHETRTYFNTFGISTGDNSFLCTLEDGASYAAVNADVSGKNNSYNYVNAIYTITNREQYEVADKYNGEMFVYEETLPEEDIVQRYSFISSSEYVDMAKTYGEYLKNRLGDNWTLNMDTSVPVGIEVIGAVDKVEQIAGIPVSRPLKLTSYKQTKDILTDLLGNGVTNISLKMTGWANGGVNQSVLTSVNTINRLGSAKDLKNTIEYAQENGVSVYLNGVTNFALDNKVFDGFVIWRDSARYVSDLKVDLYSYSTVWFGEEGWLDEYYLMKPSMIIKMMEHLSAAADKYNADGVSYEDVGYKLSADYDPDDTISRQSAMTMQVDKLSDIDSEGQKIMINMGNDYALSYVDFITNMDLNGSVYTIIDESVPFYQIAIHGYVNYAGEAINLSQDYEEEVLSSAEYGAGLYFTLMSAEAKILQKTLYTEYFGADYNAWKDKLIEIYTRYNEELGSIFNQTMTDHKILASGVRVTTYEDGTKVFVNYSYTDYVTGDGVTVPARDYVVKSGR